MHSYPKDQELNKENTIASQNAVNNSSAADCWDCPAHPPFIPLCNFMLHWRSISMGNTPS